MTDGLLLVDKPTGPTSHTAVARARRALGTRKVGHAGTLDPMATGLLVLGVNRATRLLTHVVGADKTYTATIRLGQATTTDDAEGEVSAAPGAREIDPAALAAALDALRGDIAQVPSAVSAIKVDGKRAYALVRAGQDVELAARPVHIASFEATSPRAAVAADGTPVLDLDAVVECSSGTYVRALARDLGAALGTGGHLTALRRTRVGRFDVADAVPLDALDPAAPPVLMDVTTAVRLLFPVRDLATDEARELRYGRRIGPTGRDGVVGGVGPDGRTVALLRDVDGAARPVLVLDPA